MSGPISIINRLIFKSPPKATDPNKLLTYDVDTKEVSYIPTDELVIDIEIEDVNGLQEVLDSKLDKVDYNDRFKGKYISETALIVAVPVSVPGDYAIVDAGAGENSLQYIWDNEEGWILSGEVSPETTDDLLEGTNNLYFTTARVLATTLSGISFVVGGPIVSTDTVLIAFGKIQKQITDLTTSLSLKLDKGGYTGTAQTLADSIDAIFVPDQLISALTPTRSVNTFTYPALGYTALISKTLRTNAAQFITTITAASTTNHKRVDLIYFKPDNTLAKLVGPEDLTVAPRPDVPDGAVGVSFINVFGNVIEDPTPITEEISIQNFFGVEIFKITNYMRFQNVSFDEAAKAIIIDPLVPLSVFIDPVNGNDTTAILQNSNKPFKTLNALLDSLPDSTGETYNVFITGGTLNVTRLIIPRNLKFTAYSDCTLNFSGVKLDDGLTDAKYLFRNTGFGVWTFENENISILCNFIGQRSWTVDDFADKPRITIKGTIDNFRWDSYGRNIGEWNVGAVALRGNNEFTIKNLYECASVCAIFIIYESSTINSIRILNYYFTNGYLSRIITNVASYVDLTIDNIIQQGGNTGIEMVVVGTGSINKCTLKKIKLNGVVSIRTVATISFYDNLVTDANTIIDFNGSAIVSGNISGLGSVGIGYLSYEITFRNYSGLLRGLDCYLNGSVVLENCNVTTKDYLVSRGYDSVKEDLVFFRGFNAVNQIDTNQNLFKTTPVKPILITLDTLTTNATTYGINTSYIKVQSTFKEKLNEIVIRNKIDLINRDLSSELTYVIDSTNFNAVSGDYILIPADGLTIAGYGFDTSILNKNVAGQALFKSPVGGSGNLILKDLKIDSGAGSVFDIEDSDGTHAIEFNDVNFENCASLGKIKHYRQFTGQTIGMYFCSDGLMVSGAWNGFVMSKLHVRNFAATGTLFKKDTDTNFSNRFALGVNISGVTGIKVFDFDNTIFTRDRMLQLDDCTFEVNGIINESNTSALIPNIGPNDPKCKWSNSEGITLTALLFLDMKSPDGNIWRVEVSDLGVLTVTNL